MKRVRIAAWISVAVLVLAAGAAYLLRPNFGALPGRLPLAAGIGGPFELTTQEGRRLSSAELIGTPSRKRQSSAMDWNSFTVSENGKPASSSEASFP